MSCSHKTGSWVDTSYVDDWTGEEIIDSEYVEESTMRDINISWMQCSMCGFKQSYTGSPMVSEDHIDKHTPKAEG